jgi:hypothetical protein
MIRFMSLVMIAEQQPMAVLNWHAAVVIYIAKLTAQLI